MKKKYIYKIIMLTGIALVAGCGTFKIKPLPAMVERFENKAGVVGSAKVAFKFFEEDFASGGYEYHYPDNSKVFIAEESGKNGEVAVQMDLVANDYSGGAVVLWNCLYDLVPLYATGALEFWIKGEKGGEISYAVLADDEKADGIKAEIKVPLSKYGQIGKDWSKFSIPLSDFGKRGAYWDEKNQVEVPFKFDWDQVAEFLLVIDKGDNESFRVWLDDIFIVRDVFEAKPEGADQYWDEKNEIIPVPPLAEMPNVQKVTQVFTGLLAEGSYCHVYGGKTAFKMQPTTDVATVPTVLAMYLDNSDYSGVTLNFGPGKAIDLSSHRKTKAGIAFWAKFGPDVKAAFLSLIDDESDGKKVGTNIVIADYKALDTNWQYYMVPLKEFGNEGNYWDETKGIEVPGAIEWNKIDEFCISVDKFGNRIPDGTPATVYVSDIAIIQEVPNYVDPDEYWNAFKSNEAERLLFDFEKAEDSKWEAISGEESELYSSVIDQDDIDNYGRKSLKIEYSLNDWCDVLYAFGKNSAPSSSRNWTKHWGLLFDVHTEKDEEVLTAQIDDSGKEAYTATFKIVKGWNKVILPFKKFKKYPYYQVADAVLNGKLDLESVEQVSFKPTTSGTMGVFILDNIKLTNKRE